MKKYPVIILLLFFAGQVLNAQDYTVPERMTVAGIKLKINAAARNSIQKDVDLLTRSPKYWEIKAERARTYFPIIEQIFKEEGVPEEFKYLAIQESALIADAVSSSNAVGFWQMKDFTAVELGLRVDRKVDERQNIVSASYGAAKYLKKSQGVFDNWLHSLQSYQMGIGGAEKALGDSGRGAKSMNITMRTYWYVRKYLAHYIAYENATIRPASQPVSIYSSGAGKSLNDISRETDIDLELIKEYNKWLLHGKIPDDKVYAVILPGEYKSHDMIIANSPRVRSNGNNIPEFENNSSLYPRIKESRHKDHKYIIGVNGLPGIIASSTDNAMTLATKGEISLKKFLKYNDLTSNNLIPGQVYYLKRKKRNAPTHYHTLENGETLWEVSQKYGVRLKSLLTKNRIPDSEIKSVKTGRILWLRFIRPEETPVVYSQITEAPKERITESPKVTEEEVVEVIEKEIPADTISSEVVVNPDPELDEETPMEDEPDLSQMRKISHRVKQGETYYSISKKYQTAVLDILEWNELSIHDKLSIGQIVTIYIPQGQPEATKSNGVILHTVKAGDTLYSISREYDVTVPDILKWNKKTDSALKIGEKLRIGGDR